MNEQHFAATIFSLMGSTHSPTAHRAAFQEFLNTYTTACDKCDKYQKFKSDIETIMQQNNLSVVKMKIYSDEDSEHLGFRSQSVEVHLGFAINYIFDDFEYSDDLGRFAENNVLRIDAQSLATFDTLTPEERRIYNMVEFFERDLIDNNLVSGNDRVRAHKI